jgi:hypothetical protein
MATQKLAAVRALKKNASRNLIRKYATMGLIANWRQGRAINLAPFIVGNSGFRSVVSSPERCDRHIGSCRI